MTALLTALLATAALRGSVDPALVSEARVVGGDSAESTSVEFDITPTVIARLGDRSLDVSVGYSPRFTLRGLGAEPAFDILHAAHLDAALRASKRTQFTIFGGGSVGTQLFSSARLGDTGSGASGAASIQSLPSRAALPFITLRAGAAVRYVLARRATLDALVDYGESGGRTAAAQSTIPLQIGPRFELGASLVHSPRDHSRVVAEGSWFTFSSGREAALASIRESWTHRLTRRTESTLAAGVGLGLTQGAADEPWPLALYPIAEASVRHRLPPERLDIGLAFRLTPVIDWLSGALDARVAEDATFTARITPRASLWARAGATQSVPGGANSSLTIVFGEAGVRARVAPPVELSGGARGATQTQTETGARQAQWTVFIGATISAPRLRL